MLGQYLHLVLVSLHLDNAPRSIRVRGNDGVPLTRDSE